MKINISQLDIQQYLHVHKYQNVNVDAKTQNIFITAIGAHAHKLRKALSRTNVLSIPWEVKHI